MPFEIVRNDIVNMQVDALVNTANPEPIVGAGVDKAIHSKAGEELLKARKNIGNINIGDVAITPGFNLDAKYVIHASGPVWKDGTNGEEQILANCYSKSLELAKEYKCEAIAFPLMAAGCYGFPKHLALQIAIREISNFLLENDMQVYLVVFEKEAYQLTEKLFKSVSSYIDENYISSKEIEEYKDRLSRQAQTDVIMRGMRPDVFEEDESECMMESTSVEEACGIDCMAMRDLAEEYDLPDDCIIGAPFKDYEDLNKRIDKSAAVDIDDMLQNLDAGFSETLLQLIDKTGKKDSEIYKKANVDRKLFSKIRNNIDYKPSKSTALAFAFALELDIEETKDFIARAGYALSHCNKFDVIIEYFLVNKNYNVFELNEVLFAFDQPLIGA